MCEMYKNDGDGFEVQAIEFKVALELTVEGTSPQVGLAVSQLSVLKPI